MQSDRDALLAGIVADPDADLPRLVFADWLEETGHPANCARAEYIRLAIDVENLAHTSVVERYNRIDELKAMFDDEWDVFDKLNPEFGYAMRSRGFVCQVTVIGGIASKIFQELSKRLPVDKVVITNIRCPDSDSAALPIVKGVKSLTFSDFRRIWPVAERLIELVRLPGLKLLCAINSGVSDEVLIGLLRNIQANPTLQRIECVDLYGNPLTDRAAHVLAAAAWPLTLRRLVIDGTRITNAGREVLFRRFGFEELRPRLALG